MFSKSYKHSSTKTIPQVFNVNESNHQQTQFFILWVRDIVFWQSSGKTICMQPMNPNMAYVHIKPDHPIQKTIMGESWTKIAMIWWLSMAINAPYAMGENGYNHSINILQVHAHQQLGSWFAQHKIWICTWVWSIIKYSAFPNLHKFSHFSVSFLFLVGHSDGWHEHNKIIEEAGKSLKPAPPYWEGSA